MPPIYIVSVSIFSRSYAGMESKGQASSFLLTDYSIELENLLVGIDSKFALALVSTDALLDVVVGLEVSETCLLRFFLLHFLF